ncbi:MAG: bifunctional lysine ketoglutarate reductase /saccharopine dehydrogenase family protein [Planctomycetota bacterium]
MPRIGIRREDKSRFEARTPLVPADVARLVKEHGVDVTVERSERRVFREADYESVGARVADDLSDCPIILGVKEIPPEKLEARKTYVYFSHTIKGQPANMPALRRLLELDCQLIDFEKIEDEQGRRMVFFGKFAGLAGMIDTLWALGRRLKHEGIDSAFEAVQQAYRYNDLDHARRALRDVAERIRRDGLPEQLRPFVCGFAGYGQVSQGAQEIYDVLPVEEVSPDALDGLTAEANVCYKTVFHEEHMVEPVEPSRAFELQDYYGHPKRYRSRFFPLLQHLTLMVNCIYWAPKYPRLVTLDQLRTMYGGSQMPRLRVIGDISCDIGGSVECTVKSTEPDNPVFVWEPATGRPRDGVEGVGPVVLAVDFLPCELPVDASGFFSRSLSPLIPGLAKADFSRLFAMCGLPSELERATIVYQGALTDRFKYLEEFVSGGV